MKTSKLITVSMVALLVLSVSFSSNAQTFSFLVLWQGVDPLDGGLITLSISDPDNDGELDLRFSDTFIRACSVSGLGLLPDKWEGSGAPWSKRGIYLGNAYANGDELRTESGGSGVVEIPIQVYCFASEKDISKGRTPIQNNGIPAPGHILSVILQWEFKKVAGDMIEMSGTLFGGQPALGTGTDPTFVPAAGGDLTMRFSKVGDDEVD